MGDYDEAMLDDTKPERYTLPDQSEIANAIRFGCPELFFNPGLNNIGGHNLQDLSWSIITSNNLESRRELCKNIILSGGSTLYDGFDTRFRNELLCMAP